jgi:geranylgeranyl diphosphate synthase type I
MKEHRSSDIPSFLAKDQERLTRAIRRHLPRRLTRQYLARVLGRARYAYDPDALQKALADPVWELLDRGGKRWRPVLFLLVLRLFGKDPHRFLTDAAAFELIHTGTLIVDDVEDRSALRRGKPTLHRLFGEDIAINAGNALYFLPLLHFLERDDLSRQTKLGILRAAITDLLRLHAGQGTDIVWHRGLVPSTRITERQYLQMCAYKTGCLTRLAATAAAIIGGATTHQTEALGAFAETLGVVFQIQDDLLNITESELSKQKGLGEDITEGKRSLAVIYALQRARPAQRKRLLTILDMHSSKQSLRNEAIAMIRETGAIERAHATMRWLFHRARQRVDKAFPASPAKARLHELATFLIERDI